jgi:hypothetical protein
MHAPSSPCIGSGAHVASGLISYYHGVLRREVSQQQSVFDLQPIGDLAVADAVEGAVGSNI